jgi:hypothetical protein
MASGKLVIKGLFILKLLIFAALAEKSHTLWKSLWRRAAIGFDSLPTRSDVHESEKSAGK